MPLLLQSIEEGIYMNNIIDKKSIIGFIMAGDPDLSVTKDCIAAMSKAGADAVEIGIPFSDPIADSNIVQAANLRALHSKTHPDKIFDMIEDVRKMTDIKIIFHSYINPVFNYGYEKFFKKCAQLNISGIFIPDLPYEEKSEIEEYADKYGISIIPFIVPSSKQRIEKLSKEAEGCIYFQPTIGAGKDKILEETEQALKLIKQHTDTPVAICSCVDTIEQADYFSKFYDGLVINSAIVKIIEKYLKESPSQVYDYIHRLKTAI